MKAVNILWDTDNDENLAKLLPSEIEIPDEFDANDIDSISDYISDITGFCHKGFKLDYEIEKSNDENTDIEKLNKLYQLLNINSPSVFAFPLVFYKNHILISSDYFRSDKHLFELIQKNIFSRSSDAMVSFRDETYVSLDVIIECLETKNAESERTVTNFEYYEKEILKIMRSHQHISYACDDIIKKYNIPHNAINELASIFRWGTSPYMPRPDALEKLNFDKEIKIDKNKEIIVYQNSHSGIKIEIFPELKKYNVIFKKQNEFLDATTTNAIYSILKNM